MKAGMGHKVDIGVLGATGAVGQTFLRILEERAFPVGELRLLASARSVGKTLPFRGEHIPVHAVADDSFDNLNFVLSCANDNISRELAPIAARASKSARRVSMRSRAMVWRAPGSYSKRYLRSLCDNSLDVERLSAVSLDVKINTME